MTDTFGDIEEADIWDADPTVDPLQVAIRIHLLRRAVILLTGGDDLGDWEDQSRRDRDDGLEVGDTIADYVADHDPNNPARAAEIVHNTRRLQTGNTIGEWADLSPAERQIGIDLLTLILDYLEREGPR